MGGSYLISTFLKVKNHAFLKFRNVGGSWRVKLETKKGGFTIVPNEVLESSKIDGLSKLILVIIAKFLPNSFPSLGTIARLAGLSERHVRRKLRLLEKLHVIYTANRPGTSHVFIPYWLPDPGLPVRPPRTPVSALPRTTSPPNNTNLNKTNLSSEIPSVPLNEEKKRASEGFREIRNLVKMKSIP